MDKCSGLKALKWEDCTLTVREVKVMHMPPKPLKVRAMKIRTESSANDRNVSLCMLATKPMYFVRYEAGSPLGL